MEAPCAHTHTHLYLRKMISSWQRYTRLDILDREWRVQNQTGLHWRCEEPCSIGCLFSQTEAHFAQCMTLLLYSVVTKGARRSGQRAGRRSQLGRAGQLTDGPKAVSGVVLLSLTHDAMRKRLGRNASSQSPPPPISLLRLLYFFASLSHPPAV